MGTKHVLKEMAFAKDVTKEFPLIIEEFAQTAKFLYKYRRFACVAHVLAAVEDSLVMAKRQLKHYEEVYKSKGQE